MGETEALKTSSCPWTLYDPKYLPAIFVIAAVSCQTSLESIHLFLLPTPEQSLTLEFTSPSSGFSSVAQLCLTLWDPMDCSMPAFPVHHQLPELAQTHVLWVSDAIQPSYPVIPFSSCLQSFPASRSFPKSQSFASGGQSIGVSVSASVLPMNIQDWFPLGFTGWFSLQSKGLARVFSNITVQKHQLSGAQLSL